MNADADSLGIARIGPVAVMAFVTEFYAILSRMTSRYASLTVRAFGRNSIWRSKEPTRSKQTAEPASSFGWSFRITCLSRPSLHSLTAGVPRQTPLPHLPT